MFFIRDYEAHLGQMSDKAAVSDARFPARAEDGEKRTEHAKRDQILCGARTIFRAKGYDGASMETIAREAGVSKGTLYVYFSNKEELFKTLILEERLDQPETIIEAVGPFGNIEEDLRRIGRAYLVRLSEPARLSTLRMVVGAVEKFPEFGALVYEEGPAKGCEILSRYIEARISRAEIKPCQPEQAASHFLSLCVSQTLRRLLLNVGDAPTEAEIQNQINMAVDVFLAAYGTRSASEG